ncbi:unnamed protein product [Echinostoma caproni]|uniref:R3H-assoc domain-containing protein n=1 Tax=Echinostoma caproni TaxID=27848 RepID=A0A183AVW7_9TREM|nr:unnamed protein product [Echinostoma caproni]
MSVLSIRAIWDMFIALTEAEQTRLLGSFYARSQMKNAHPELSDLNGDYSDGDTGLSSDECVKRRGPPKSRRGAAQRKTELRSGPKGDACIDTGSFAVVASTLNASLDTELTDDLHYDGTQLELRDSLSRRFADLLSKPHNPLPINGRRKHNGRIRRAITSLDLCLIHRVESELRRWFSVKKLPTGAGDSPSNISKRQPSRWTPTLSLVCRTGTSEELSTNNLLCLDAFERLLVHSVANYLGLFSYSIWSDKLGERQLWVELRVGQLFNPPERTFVNLIESRLTTGI